MPADLKMTLPNGKSGFNPTSNTATTSADGGFTLDGFEVSGNIFLEAQSDGRSSGDLGPLTLTANGIQDMEVVLHPTGSLSGRVVDLDGNPVGDTGMHVDLRSRSMGHNTVGGHGTALDEEGAFKIENLTAGSYGLYVDASPNIGTTGIVIPIMTVELAIGQHLAGIELPIDYDQHLQFRESLASMRPLRRREELRTVEVQGRVIHGGTNEPIENFRVRGQYTGNGVRPSDDPFANKEGRFSIRPRHGDEVELVVEATGYAPGRAEFSVNERGGVSGGDIVIRLEPGAAVDGRVVDEQGTPVVGASVYVNFDPTLMDGGVHYLSPDRAAITDNDGSFSLDSLATEPTTLYVQHPSFAPISLQVIPVPSRPTSVEVVMNSGGTIEGSVWLNGAPVLEANLMLLNADGVNVETRGVATDAEGRYRLDHLSPGEYTVYTGVTADYQWTQRWLVLVSEGTATQVDFFSPVVPGIIEGTVLLDGKIPENLNFRLEIETDYGSERVSNMGWIKTGNFLAENLPSGWATLSITATDANHERVTATEEFQIGEGATLRMDFDLQTQ